MTSVIRDQQTSRCDGSPEVLGLVRRWAVDWLAAGRAQAAEEVLAEDYDLRIGSFSLAPRQTYVEATSGQLALYPGLGVTVHDVVTDGTRVAVRLSEHGPSARHGDAAASWRVVALFEAHAGRLARSWAEEDYHARRRQLMGEGPSRGGPDPVDRPAAAPWAVRPLPAEPGVEDVLREWVGAGMPRRPGVVRDDEDLVSRYEDPFIARTGELDVLVVSGLRAGFHGRLLGRPVGVDDADHPEVELGVAGLVTVQPDGTLAGHVVTNRLGLPRPPRRGA